MSGTPAFYPSRPTILLDGQENASLSAGLLTMLVQEGTDGLYRCELSFGNWGVNSSGEVGTLYNDMRLLGFGKTLAVRVGEGDTAAQVFHGRISALEGQFAQTRPPEIIVLAEDRLQDLRMTRRTRSFEDVSDADIVRTIASDHGLQADVTLTGPTHRVLTQVNQSDLAFLRERARAVGAEVWVEERKLLAKKRDSRRGRSITLTHGQGLMEFAALADLAHQRTSITVSGWDAEAKALIEHETTDSILSGELNGGRSGAAILQQAFGKRPDRIVHQVLFTQQEAQLMAEAQYRQAARRFVTGSGLTQGDGRIRVGASVNLRGVGDMFNGEYYVTEAQHTFDGQNGYRTHFRVERPGLSV